MRKPIKYIITRKWLLFLVVISFLYFIIPLPGIDNPCSTVLESQEGHLLGAKIASDGQWRFPGLDSIPKKVEKSLLYFEDEYFYYHPGINPASLWRAARQNMRAGKIVSGGSTITMQLVRIAMGNKKRTYPQKMLEMLLATKYELFYSKKEILKMYLDNAPFGGNVVGVEAAAWRYYGRPPHQLSWAESATLAVLPNAPSLIYPGKGQEQLRNKRDKLLHKLYKNGELDSLDYSLALLEELPKKPHDLPRHAPHLLERFALNNAGKRLNSTINLSYQEKTRDIVDRHHRMLAHNQIHNAAAILIDNRSKQVRAYIGNTQNKAPEHGSAVDIITAPRSTGSILKPFLFAAMISDGLLLPGMLVADIPTQLQGYSPKNFTLQYDGAVPAKRALSRSLNVPAVRMLQSYGVDRFLEYLREMQIESIDQTANYYGLSLILGGAEASLWNLTSSYASMAGILNNYAQQSGRYAINDWDKISYRQINGKKASNKNHMNEEFSIFSASAIYSTFKALLEVNRPENQLGWEMFSSSRKIAWKTGTSFGYKDAWAIGVTPEYTVGVWVGNADGEGRPGLTGATAAAPILFDIFDILPPTTWFLPPYDDMIQLPVCRESGYIVSEACEHTDTIWASAQVNKSGICPFHKIIHLDSTGIYQVNSECYPQQDMLHKSWFVLPPSWEWYYRRHNPFYKELPPYHPDCIGKGSIPMMEFLYPASYTNISVPRGMNGAPGEVVFQLVHRKSNVKVFWHLDDNYLGATKDFHEWGIQPAPGEHVMTVIDELGNTLRRRFNVLDKKK